MSKTGPGNIEALANSVVFSRIKFLSDGVNNMFPAVKLT